MLEVSDLTMVGSALGKGQDTRREAREDTRPRVGPYRVIRRIGSGGMASVFEAEDEALGQRVALKQLHPHIAERAGATARFFREGRAAARVHHPHVVQVYALGRGEDAPYLAMELLEGHDLAALLARDGKMSVEAALLVLLPVLAGVAAAHDAGVIHRDLKPSNVFVAASARGPSCPPCPKVVDFGVSKLIAGGDTRDLTGNDAVIGTAAYMAPEQARAVHNASFRSDQYALSVILYECVTGEVPFGGSNFVEILQALMTEPVVPPSQRAGCVPPGLDDVILRAMSRAPGDRFASVRAFGAALLPFAPEGLRSVWAAELSDRPEVTPPSEPPARDDDADEPLSMRPTLLAETVRATGSDLPRSRRGRLLALAALVAVASGVVASVRARAPARAGGSPEAPSGSLPAEPASSPVAAPSGTVSGDAAAAEPATPAMASRESITAKVHSAPRRETPRASPHPLAAPAALIPSAPSAPSAETPAAAPVRPPAARPILLGDNGAPILP